MKSVGELLAEARRQPDQLVERQIVEALVTTESSFFRDHHPFEWLRTDGYLLLGAAETTINLDDSYRRVEPLKSGFYHLHDGRSGRRLATA